MKKYEYQTYDNPTKDQLDSIQVGDYVLCNDWKRPMIVVAVSKNYFIMIQRHFGDFAYSICEKLPRKYTHNYMYEGLPTIGPDNYYGYYDYTKLDQCKEALIRLEDGYTYIGSCNRNEHPNYYDWEKTANPITLEKGRLEIGRRGISLNCISVKKSKWNKDNIQEYLDKYFKKERI